MTQYRTPGVWWQPRSKKELIDWLIKSGRWNDTKKKLLDMETKQIRGIYNSIRQKIEIDMMRKPVEPLKTTAQVGDKTKEGVEYGT